MMGIDEIHNRTIEKCKFFRDSQIWLNSKVNYKGWLGNFSEEERKVMALVLDFFVFFNDEMINHLLVAAISKAERAIAEIDYSWTFDKLYTDCLFSYMPGAYRPSESGRLFPRKLRNHLGIPESQLVDQSDLRQILKDSSVPLKVILVDDFVGSGEQCCNLWNRFRPGDPGTFPPTMGEICRQHQHTLVYAPLVATLRGYERLMKECEGLSLTPVHILGSEYNIFNSNCPCWHGNYELFRYGTEIISQKSQELNIPQSFSEEVSVRGYQGQGLALSFYDSVPDAIPAIFYWKKNWTPLVQRNYIHE